MNPLNQPNVALDLCVYLKECLPDMEFYYWYPEEEKTFDFVQVWNVLKWYNCWITRYRVEIRVHLCWKWKTFEDWRKIIRQVNDCLWTRCDKAKIWIRWSKIWKVIPVWDDSEFYLTSTKKQVVADLFIYLCD